MYSSTLQMHPLALTPTCNHAFRRESTRCSQTRPSPSRNCSCSKSCVYALAHSVNTVLHLQVKKSHLPKIHSCAFPHTFLFHTFPNTSLQPSHTQMGTGRCP